MTMGIPIVTKTGAIQFVKIFSSFSEGYHLPVGLRRWMIKEYKKEIDEIQEKLK